MPVIDSVARLKAQLEHILYRTYLQITGKRMFPACIGEEGVHLEYDIEKSYKGNKGRNIFRGSI